MFIVVDVDAVMLAAGLLLLSAGRLSVVKSESVITTAIMQIKKTTESLNASIPIYSALIQHFCLEPLYVYNTGLSTSQSA